MRSGVLSAVDDNCETGCTSRFSADSNLAPGKAYFCLMSLAALYVIDSPALARANASLRGVAQRKDE